MTTIKKFSTDSGIIGDGITNDSTLTLEGTATAGSTVRVYDGATLLGSATANSSGAWSYTTGTLTNGSHSFTAATTSTTSPSSGFPDASTTGVLPGTSLTNAVLSGGDFHSSGAGQIIEGLNIRGVLIIDDPGVIVRNCQAEYILVTADNVRIEDTTVVGENVGDSGITILFANNTTVQRCDISGVENGIWLEGNGALIADNYIHGLRNDAAADPHYDGLQIPGGSGVSNALITHNNFDLDNSIANACITMADGTNIDITNNRLNGGSYVIYFEGNSTGCDVINNVFTAHTFGYFSGHSENAQTYSGNVFADAGGSTSTASTTTTDTSTPLTIRVDTVAPFAPMIATATNNANGGLNLTGAAEANSVVTVYDGATTLGTATANSSGVWGYTTGNLGTGSHNLTARATDAAGNTGAASGVVTASTGTSPAPTLPAAPKITSFSNDSGTAGDGVTNDSTLTLTGSAAAGSVVNVSDGTTPVGTTTANSSGVWSYTTAALSDGNHSLTATATTASGTSAASSTFGVQIDTIAPNAPTIATPVANASGGFNLTGAAEANSVVTVYDGANQIGTATANSGGVWGYTTGTLPTGSHSLTARATDAAGNTGAASGVVTANTGTSSAPSISSFSNDSGAAGDHITNDSTLILTGASAANSTVQLYDGATLLGSATANSSGAWSYTTGTLQNGTHSFTAATPGASNPTSGFPDASTTGVLSGTTLTNAAVNARGEFTSSSAGQIIEGLNVRGILVIDDPGVIVRNCQAEMIIITADNVTIQDCTVAGRGLVGSSGIVIENADNATLQRNDVSNFENGIWLEGSGCLIADNYIHNLIPYNPVTDPHIDGLQIPGGSGVSNNLITHNNFDLARADAPNADNGVNACITMADATNIDITNNRLSGGGFTIYFEGGNNPFGGGDTTGCDVTNNVFGGHVYGYVAGQSEVLQIYTGNVTAAGAALVQSNALEDLVVSTASTGTASRTATASTVTADTSAPLVVTVDTVAPKAPTIATPTSNANGGLNLTGAAEANSVVTVYDGANQIGTATANSSGVWGYTTGILPAGSHSLTARATDAAGNTGAASGVVTVSTGTSPTPPAAPKINSFSNDSGVGGDGITNDNTLTLTGTAAAYSKVNVLDGGTQIGTAIANGSGGWSYTTTPLLDGNHSITASVTDSSGHTSAASSALAVSIDTMAPNAPNIASYTSDGGTTASSATLSTAGATHADHLTLKGSAEANSTVWVFDGNTQIGTTTTNSSGTWYYTASNLADGTHSFTSRAVDAAGNTSARSAGLSVNVDTHTEAPTVEFTNVQQKWNDKVVFNGTADPNDRIAIYDNGGATPVGTVKARADGTFSVTTSSSLSDDVVHRFTATVTDSSTGQTNPAPGSVVLGTTGDNRLSSTSGNDLFRGNGGHDTFEFAANFGQDVITDFGAGRRGHDVVEFSRTVFDDFADVLAHASQHGQDVVIDAGAGNTLTLKNTSLTALDRTDFHFV